MARKPLLKIGNIAEAGETNKKFYSASILKVSTNGNIAEDPEGTFLLNPSTWEENKSSNWSPNMIPGQSGPIYQWISGGPRIVSFEALVTNDTSHYLNPPKQESGSLIDSALGVVGEIASAFAGVSIPPIGDMFGGVDEQAEGTELSIVNKLRYYRSLTLPEYNEDKNAIIQSPPLVALVVGKTFSNDNMVGNNISSGGDATAWAVTNLNIKITKQLPNLDPMEATVQFTLHEYLVEPKGRKDLISQPGATTLPGDLGFSVPLPPGTI